MTRMLMLLGVLVASVTATAQVLTLPSTGLLAAVPRVAGPDTSQDVTGGTGPAGATAASGPARVATLPEPTSSFGAAVSDGWLYVYGGHVARTHSYSTDAVSGRFHRLNLEDGVTWERLPDGPPLQGLNLLAHGNRIYRVGGMQPRNEPGTPPDVRSVADVARFDPATGRWEALPPLPDPRSSHDVVAVGDSLVVVGGWSLRGADPTEWPDGMDVLDLDAPVPAWRRIPQPFMRRALTAAVLDGKVYVLGGFDERSQVVRAVSVYDVHAGTWSSAPDLPGGAMSGFGPAACVADGALYVSIDDGGLYRLGTAGWELIGRTSPRIVHRCVPDRQRILVIGGAHAGDNSDLVEAVPVTAGARTDPSAADRWPAFRGDGTSRSRAAGLPTRWSGTEHAVWRVPLAGHGQSSPVVWGDQVFVTSVAGANKEQAIVSSHGLADGREAWRREFAAARQLADTDTTGKAAPTPVVDADRVYALFESGDVIALGHDGREIWRRSLMDDYGDILNGHQYGSSPVLAGDVLIVLVGHRGPSYLAGLDATTGRTRWRVERPSVTTWTTPVLAHLGERSIVIVPGTSGIDAHDTADGRLVWTRTGVTPAPIASPTVDGSRVIVASGARGGTGAVSLDGSRVEWVAEEIATDFSSPLVHGGLALFVNNVGVLQAVDADTGRVLWRERLPGPCWASAISAGGLAYFFTTQGTTVVIDARPDGPRVVAENVLPVEGRVYGVAVAGDSLVMRTDRALWRISSTGPR